MIIRNRFLPFGSFLAINLCGLIFVRRGRSFTPTDLNHERIHSRQQRELLYLPFFLFYLLEYLFRLLQTFLPDKNQEASPLNHASSSRFLRAYFRVSFEREAYTCQSDPDYLSRRHPFAWRHYF